MLDEEIRKRQIRDHAQHIEKAAYGLQVIKMLLHDSSIRETADEEYLEGNVEGGLFTAADELNGVVTDHAAAILEILGEEECSYIQEPFTKPSQGGG